jgi:S-DNA-T family DNA segregation ATPase FtsK/SpoIIIE
VITKKRSFLSHYRHCSYNANDNSLFHFSNQQQGTSNLAGFLGANAAALFFYLLGQATFIFLFCIGLTIFILFANKNFKDIRGRIFWNSVFFCVTTTLLAIIKSELNWGISGGILGSVLTNIFYLIAGPRGSIVILLAMVWVSVASFLRLPLFPFLALGLRKLKELLQLCFNYPVRETLRQAQGERFLFGLFRRKKPDNSKVMPASNLSTGNASAKDANTDGTSADLDYWKALLEKQPEQKEAPTLATSETRPEPVKHNFENKKLRIKTEKFGQGKLAVKLLANTVLQKNILEHTNTETQTKAATEPTLPKNFVLPDLKIFAKSPTNNNLEVVQKEAEQGGKKLEEKLLCFGVKGNVVSIKPGPVITMFEYKPEIDSKISKITAMEDDLAMALTAKSLRILAPIPGKNVVGFEISNKTRQDVYFSDTINSAEFHDKKINLPLVLGVDVIGRPVIDDLSKMPHLLVGGATGSGKSVGLHTMIISLICRLNPGQAKLILIDPKRLEFGAYADIPHLLFPIVTSADTAISTLRWVVQEMEQRYIKMASAGVRNINEYQERAKFINSLENMPYIVLIIDEMADLMMVGGKDLELLIVRIAQMARASGIHMIVATQRPSVEVVTGLIKVNFPSRISFRVSSKIDSRTVLDSAGAEKLLGRGDLLFKNSSSSDLQRAHGAYVSDAEIRKVVDCWKEQQKPNYLNLHEELKVITAMQASETEDEIYDQVIEFIQKNDEVSISLLQRYFRIGFNRSARLIEKLEMDGLISPTQGGSKTRKVLR